MGFFGELKNRSRILVNGRNDGGCGQPGYIDSSSLEALLTGLERSERVRALIPSIVNNWTKAPVLDSCVVSVASYGPRIATLSEMLVSVGFQTCRPVKLILNIPSADFPRKMAALPADLLMLIDALGVEVNWVADDLGPHNKYFEVARSCSDWAIITLDDDNYYQPESLGALWRTSMEFPDDVVAMRTHKMTYTDDGKLRPYVEWEYEQRKMIGKPSHSLFATGVGGVLYPPNAFPEAALNSSVIRDLCLCADDIWLKFWTAHQGLRVVQTDEPFVADQIAGSQVTSLCGRDVYETGSSNDRYIDKVVAWFNQNNDILSWMNEDDKR